MDFELAYVQRRAAEERQAANSANSPSDRDQHLKLARAFEDHLSRIAGVSELRVSH